MANDRVTRRNSFFTANNGRSRRRQTTSLSRTRYYYYYCSVCDACANAYVLKSLVLCHCRTTSAIIIKTKITHLHSARTSTIKKSAPTGSNRCGRRTGSSGGIRIIVDDERLFFDMAYSNIFFIFSATLLFHNVCAQNAVIRTLSRTIRE